MRSEIHSARRTASGSPLWAQRTPLDLDDSTHRDHGAVRCDAGCGWRRRGQAERRCGSRQPVTSPLCPASAAPSFRCVWPLPVVRCAVLHITCGCGSLIVLCRSARSHRRCRAEQRGATDTVYRRAAVTQEEARTSGQHQRTIAHHCAPLCCVFPCFCSLRAPDRVVSSPAGGTVLSSPGAPSEARNAERC